MRLKKYTMGDTCFYFTTQYGDGYGWFNGNLNKMYRISNRMGYFVGFNYGKSFYI